VKLKSFVLVSNFFSARKSSSFFATTQYFTANTQKMSYPMICPTKLIAAQDFVKVFNCCSRDELFSLLLELSI